MAHAVGGPSLHAVHNLSVVHMDGDVADEESKGHEEGVDLAGGTVEIVVRYPTLVGDLDAVVVRVDLHDRPTSCAVAGLVGADQGPVGEHMASEGASAVGASRGPGEGGAVCAAGPRRQPGLWEKATAVERVVLRGSAPRLDCGEIEGLYPRGSEERAVVEAVLEGAPCRAAGLAEVGGGVASLVLAGLQPHASRGGAGERPIGAGRSSSGSCDQW